MKKFVLPILCGSLLILSACGSGSPTSTGTGESAANSAGDKQKTVNIGISQIVEHPSLDAAREGFIAALKEGGYKEGENLQVDFQNAQGDMNNNTSIAQKLVNDKEDLILAISTPSAQALAQATKDIPVLFTAITDPLGAKLVQSLEQPGGNVTGTSDTHPNAIKETMNAIKKFYPNSKKVGVIYNSGEQNSVVNVENAKKVMQEIGLEAVEATASNSSEVKQAAESLIGRVDAIYVPKDNTVVSAVESVVAVANANKIPTFAGESDSVKRGIFAAFGFEYYDLGYQTGKMALEVLQGKKVAEVGVGFPEKLDLVINKKTADQLGFSLSDEMKSAKLVGE